MPWASKRSNKEVTKEAEKERQAITKLKKRQSRFTGHATRAGGLEYLITTGMTDGEKEIEEDNERR